jgi:hypothetical protein
MEFRRSLNGAIAGSVAAAVWAAQQPLDKRAFGCDYDDVEMLGKLVSRDEAVWPAAGLAMHVGNGAVFGAAYAQARPFLPGHPLASALLAGMAEHFGSWPGTQLIDNFHPARWDIPKLFGNRRALAQATWRHVLFAVVMGELERRLNADAADEPPPVPASSNGHGNIELAVGAT